MKCPHQKDLECTEVNTSAMTQLNACSDCQLINTYGEGWRDGVKWHQSQLSTLTEGRNLLIKFANTIYVNNDVATQYVDEYLKQQPCSNCNKEHEMSDDECYKLTGKAT